MWFNLSASRASEDDRKVYANGRDFVATKLTAAQVGEAQRQHAATHGGWRYGTPHRRCSTCSKSPASSLTSAAHSAKLVLKCMY